MVMFLLKCMILEHSSEAQHRPARCRRISISIFMFEYYFPMDFYVHKRSCSSQQSESPQP